MKSDRVGVLYGADMKKMAYDALSWAEADKALRADMKVGIKPNLVVAKPASSGATTHTELVEGVIDYLKDAGIRDITIMEGSWVGDSTRRAFKVCGYEDLARQTGVKLLDLKGDTFKTYKGIAVCDAAMNADFLVNMPVLKGHCQTVMTCAMKNLKGAMPDSEKRRFHAQGLHRPIATLNTILKPGITVVDGICGDLNFEEGGNPVPMNRVLVGVDSVLIDACVCRMMGIDQKDVPYIGLGAQMGAGSDAFTDETLVEMGGGAPNGKLPTTGRIAQRLSAHIDERDACSACYGSLIHALYQLDERGRLGWLEDKICIGQGFRGVEGLPIGVGNCARGCAQCVTGCPPRADRILEFLMEQL